MRTLEEIEKEIEALNEESSKAFQLPTIEEYMERCEEIWDLKMPLLHERNRLAEPEWEEDAEFADLMTIEEFKECCESGGFVDDDGFGLYSDGKRESNVGAYPSMFCAGLIADRPEFTHVSWYNK